MSRIAIGVFAGLALALTVLVAGNSAEEVNNKTVMLFNGQDLKGWTLRNEKNSHWVVGVASLDEKAQRQLSVVINADQPHHLINDLKVGQHGCDIYTEEKFGDCLVEVELMIPKGSNSGI